MARKEAALQIEWRPDRQSKTPIYKQIISHFSMQIRMGNWLSGQALPSQRRLSEIFGVNRSTIIQAMDELISLGLIESDFGGGTHIANDSWSLILKNDTPNWRSYVESGRFQANFPTVQAINRYEFQEGIIRMSTGELSPDLVQGELTKSVMGSLSRQNLYMNYPDPLGMPSLREAVQDYLCGFGIKVPTSCILIVSGALQALQLISMGIVPKNATIHVESPSYLGSLNVFQSIGAQLNGVQMDEHGIQPWMISELQGGKRTSLLYIIPTFQNPTGCVMPASRRRELLNYCRMQHMPIIEDDIFRDLWLDTPPPAPIKTLDNSGNVVYIGSISKCFSPGLRLGWLVGPRPVVERLADVKMQTDYGVSVLTQQVVAELFRRSLYQEGVAAVRAQLRYRRDFMIQLLGEYFSDFATWNRPSGGFFIWIKLNRNIPANQLFDKALKEKLLILPGNVYDAKYTHHLRLTYGYLSEADMTYGIRTLSEIIRRMLNR